MTLNYLRLENGGRLPYLDIGDSAASPVLVLRGLGDGLGTVEQDYVANGVQAQCAPYPGYRFVVPSWRVPAPAGHDISAMAADAARLITELRLGPVGVWGISMGGMVALRLAETHPGLVTRAVCECTPARPGPALRSYLTRWTELAAQGRWTKLQRETLGRIFTGHMPWPVRWQQLLAWRIPRPDDPARFGILASAIHGWEPGRRAAAVECPVLVVGGRQDVMTPPEDLGELVRALPDARLHILERSGHGVSLEQPAQARAQIEPFLAASTSDARPAQSGRG
jgi:3-oxoadipate enol-lactonase